MHKLGIERLCVFGMPPLDFAALAQELGADCIGIGLTPSGTFNPHGHPDWSLRDDAALRRDFTAAVAERGLFVSIVEGFAVAPGQDVRGFARDLDLVRELGGTRIACVSLDKDLQRTIEGFAVLAEMAGERGLLVSAEMGSLGPYGLVAPALEVARGVGLPNFTLMVDAMHFFRLGNTVEDLAAMDPALIGYSQLCDAPWAPRFDTYMEEAMYERMVPGEGELPLADFLRLLPADIVVSLEIPQRSLAERGVDSRERVRRYVEAARGLMTRA